MLEGVRGHRRGSLWRISVPGVSREASGTGSQLCCCSIPVRASATQRAGRLERDGAWSRTLLSAQGRGKHGGSSTPTAASIAAPKGWRSQRKASCPSRSRVIDSLPGIPVPTLVLVGHRTALSRRHGLHGPRHSERTKVVLPGAGHVSNLDQPGPSTAPSGISPRFLIRPSPGALTVPTMPQCQRGNRQAKTVRMPIAID